MSKGCVNAYINLSVGPGGIVKPCCMSHHQYKTDSGAVTLNNDSILNFWNSKDRQKFIQQLDAGKKLKECHACWSEEDAGKDSKRIRDNKTFQSRELDNNMLPVVLDLQIGNLCNIKCRICGPVHSTPWVAEEKALSKNSLIAKFVHHVDDNAQKAGQDSFDHSNTYFWDDIVKLLPNVEKYDFAGGEPFFIEKHWDIVKAAVDGGWSKNQHIHYNTNGTIYPSKYMHLLEEFDMVDIQISSDGVGEKFEYMRHPAKWDKVEENIDKFIKAKTNSKTNWMLGMCISISAFNVYDFFETFEHYADKGIGLYINIVHDRHGVRILPTALKEKIIEKLMACKSKHTLIWEKERDVVCNHLLNTTPSSWDWKMFCSELKIRDEYRNQSFRDTFPEYAEIIKQLGYDYYVEK